jgi:hypothetical protein
MLTEEQFKKYVQAYNDLIDRYKKAEKYLEDNEIPITEREKRIPEATKLMNRMSKAIDVFRENGINMTQEEVFNGFKERTN